MGITWKISQANVALNGEDLQIRMAILPGQESIIGGQSIEANGNFNFQVALLLIGTVHLRCGGFILSSNYAGTAAHCLEKAAPKDFSVGYGSVDLSKLQIAHLAAFYYHDGFNRKTGDSDVGLMKIVGKFHGAFSTPIPISEKKLATGSAVTVSGWGRKGGKNPQILESTVLRVINLGECRNFYKHMKLNISENMLCAHDDKSSPCSGDSGGPLTFNGTLVGIVSWGDSTCKRFPTIFTDVTSPNIAQWLKKYLH